MTNILVIGESCTDEFVYSRCDRLCPDAPVPVIVPRSTTSTGGMAHNVFDNVKCHDDVCVDLVTNTHKIQKRRYVDEASNQIIVRIDSDDDVVQRIKNLNDINFNNYDGILISDYNKGFLHDQDIHTICEHHPVVIIDTKRQLGSWASKVSFIKLNKYEYRNNLQHINNYDLSSKILATLGSRGCRHNDVLYEVDTVEVKSNSGAGDTFVACFTVKYLKTKNVSLAIEHANKCSTVVVQRKGIATWT